MDAFLRKRARARQLAERDRFAAKIRRAFDLAPGADVEPTLRNVIATVKRQIEVKATARAAWDAVERAQQRADLERRHGVLVRLRCGAIAVARRADRLPPGAERVEPAAAREALSTAPRLRVVGICGVSSPPLDPATFTRLAAPLLEAA